MKFKKFKFFLACAITFSASLVLNCDTAMSAEQWIIETIAGNGTKGFSGDGGPAVNAELDNPFGVVRGPDGAIWFCEYGGQRIRRIAADGSISTFAGNGKIGYAGDGGPAINASFNLPHEIRFDRHGNLFVADMGNHVVRKIDIASGIVTTFAGVNSPGYDGDGGPAISAKFKQPHSIQFDHNGDLYVCDIGNHVIRKIDTADGTISTFAGTGKAGVTVDGSPIAGTPLNGPRSLDFDRRGNLWLVTREGNQVFKFDIPNSQIVHQAGSGKKAFTGQNGPAKLALLNNPKGISIDDAGNAWLVDTESNTIWRLNNSTGTIELIVGTGARGDGPNGDAKQCKLMRPHGIFADTNNQILIGDSESHRIRLLHRLN